MKKIITRLILMLLVVLALSSFVPAFALEVSSAELANEENVIARAEETQWYYRMYEGRLQKRLWSITYGYWITDWADVG